MVLPGDTDVDRVPGIRQSGSPTTRLVIAQREGAGDSAGAAVGDGSGRFRCGDLNNPYTRRSSRIATAPGDFMAHLSPDSAERGIGPRHLVFNFGTDIYVLPSRVDLVQKGPPVANAVDAEPGLGR